MGSLNPQGEHSTLGLHTLQLIMIVTFGPANRRHVDVRGLPSLVPQPYVNANAQAIDAELFARIGKLHNMIESGQVEVDSDTGMYLGVLSYYLSSCRFCRRGT